MADLYGVGARPDAFLRVGADVFGAGFQPVGETEHIVKRKQQIELPDALRHRFLIKRQPADQKRDDHALHDVRVSEQLVSADQSIMVAVK